MTCDPVIPAAGTALQVSLHRCARASTARMLIAVRLGPELKKGRAQGGGGADMFREMHHCVQARWWGGDRDRQTHAYMYSWGGGELQLPLGMGLERGASASHPVPLSAKMRFLVTHLYVFEINRKSRQTSSMLARFGKIPYQLDRGGVGLAWQRHHCVTWTQLLPRLKDEQR